MFQGPSNDASSSNVYTEHALLGHSCSGSIRELLGIRYPPDGRKMKVNTDRFAGTKGRGLRHAARGRPSQTADTEMRTTVPTALPPSHRHSSPATPTSAAAGPSIRHKRVVRPKVQNQPLIVPPYTRTQPKRQEKFRPASRVANPSPAPKTGSPPV